MVQKFEEELRGVYFDAILGMRFTTKFTPDALDTMVEAGWLVESEGSAAQTVPYVWNFEFLLSRSLEDLQKIYWFCKNGRARL